MIKTRQTLIEALKLYPVTFEGEEQTRNAFLELATHPDSFQRTHLPGHFTGSPWIVNEALTKTVLIFHAKLKRWLQPGGHADGDEDLLNVALREADEETGLKKIQTPDTTLFDLDVHPIPERKEFPAHLHYDVRFLCYASEADPLLISDESTDLKWIDLDDVQELTGNNPSVMRMVAKTINLRSH